MQKLSVIIPAHNEEKSIIAGLKGVKEALKTLNVPSEVIVINDGSTDNTKNLLENEGGLFLINHPYKKGYGFSLKHGVKKATGDFVLFIDADGQQDPQDIPNLTKDTSEYEMVVGARININSCWRALAKKILSRFGNYLAEYKIPDLNSGFRIVKKEIFENYAGLLPQGFSLSATLTLACIKDRVSVKFVPIKELPRMAGKSKINPGKDFVRLIMLILRLTVLFSPLRVFLPASVFLFLVGSAYIIASIVKEFNVPDGGIFLVLSSIIIFFFGLLADQIAYIRRKVK